MKKLVEDLLLILNKERDLYRQALILAEDKKDIIIDGKIKELEALTSKEQALIGTLIKLENMRSQVLDQLIISLQAGHVESLTDLMQFLDEASKVKIEMAKNELSSVVNKLKDKNELNGKLLEQSLDLIEINMELIAGLEADGRYDSQAVDKKGKVKSNLFDAKV